MTAIARDYNRTCEALYLLKNNRFVVADFQRDYEWNEDMVKSLIGGYFDDHREGDPYTSLGTISGYHRDEQTFVISDGQQRILTLLLIAAAARRAALAMSGGQHGRALREVFIDSGLGATNEPRISFPHVDGVDAVFREVCADTHEKFATKGRHTATAAQILRNAEALRVWFTEAFAGRPEEIEPFLVKLYRELPITQQTLPSRRIAIRDYTRQNSNVKPLKQIFLIKNIVISAGDAGGVTDVVSSGWARFEALAGSKSEDRESVLHNIFTGTHGTIAHPVKRAQMFAWFEENLDTLGVNRDPVAFVEWLSRHAKAVRETTKDHLSDAAHPAVKLLARARPKRGAHSPVVCAAVGLPDMVFAHVCLRLAATALLTSSLGLRGGDLTRPFGYACEQLRALQGRDRAPSTTDIDRVFDKVTAMLASGREAEAWRRLSERQFGHSGLDARLVLGLAALTFEPAHRHRALLDQVTSDHTQVEHIWAQCDEPWDAAAPGEPPLLLAPDPAAQTRIGNQTLLGDSENGSAGNKAYAKKLPYYAGDPLLMTRILQPDFDTNGLSGGPAGEVATARAAAGTSGPWTGARIVKRSEDLARRALRSTGLAIPEETPPISS